MTNKHMTPLKAIRMKCLNDCCSGQTKEVRLCPDTGCYLYQLRFGKKIKGCSPLNCIKKKCRECGESIKDMKLCEIKDCPLYPYRFGKNDKRRGIGGNGVANTN